MTTRFEQIAAAFPLHAQRIAELAHSAGRFDTFLQETPAPREHPDNFATNALLGSFCWSATAEGFDYWEALAFREGYVERWL